jgi:hypothetical protein
LKKRRDHPLTFVKVIDMMGATGFTVSSYSGSLSALEAALVGLPVLLRSRTRRPLGQTALEVFGEKAFA